MRTYAVLDFVATVLDAAIWGALLGVLTFAGYQVGLLDPSWLWQGIP